MNKNFKIPPKLVSTLTSGKLLSEYFNDLVGSKFVLTNKTRTDGSNIRKLIASVLEKHPLPELAEAGHYEIVPPKAKGIPKITREFIDTYIITSGSSYNLQVWNRNPAVDTLLITYESGENLKCTDVKFVFVKINMDDNTISSIVVLTPAYIERKFGKFGKPTIKQQLLISGKIRNNLIKSESKIILYQDSKKLSTSVCNVYSKPTQGMTDEPKVGDLFSINLLKELVADKLIGFKLPAAATKNRGQALEKKVLELLGYDIKDSDLLCGDFPDIRNQLLEVKVQDSPTVDLGKFSPEKEESVTKDAKFTTFDIRYLIALTNPKTEEIEGIILSPGEKLGELFSYVSAESYKCQRSIPMSFFDKYHGRSVFNPD